MENYKKVKEKLEAFIKKYYINLILKGFLLFLTAGLVYFIIIAFLEHFLWFGTTGRSILFWLFIGIEFLLLFFFIGIPFLKLLKLSKGINEYEASRLIGRHFPEVSDRLTNLLELNNCNSRSELIIASIDQRSKELHDIPFPQAIDLSRNKYYLKFILFPVLIIAGLFFAGNIDMLTNSFARITNYEKAYAKPAPFKFFIINDSLKVREDKSYILRVTTDGAYVPETIEVYHQGIGSFMKQVSPNLWEFTFDELTNGFDFYLQANDVISKEFRLDVIKVPRLIDFEVILNYPKYLGRTNRIETGTGNLTVPEGTEITWNFRSRNTTGIQFFKQDSTVVIPVSKDFASFSDTPTSSFNYRISTENTNITNYEPLDYSVSVVKDEHPKIEIERKIDSINIDYQYFKGVVSDDYGIRKLELVYYLDATPDNKSSVNVPLSKSNFAEFLYGFPGNLNLMEGESYSFFFRAFDNDHVNGSKTSVTQVFNYRQRTDEEIEKDLIQDQKETIEDFSNDLKKWEKYNDELNELNRLEKESEDLDYNEKRKLEEFLKRQQEQNSLMKNYSEKLKNNLKDFQKNHTENSNKELMRRIEENEKNLERNESLLKELEKYTEKINKEDLGEKLDKLSKQNQNSKRNLSQLLELTKKYYVEEKKQKLARNLEKLAEEQERLSKEEEGELDQQQDLNKKFEEFQKELDELEKENQDLKEPQDLGREKSEENSIKEDQQEAEKNLKDRAREEAKKKQEDAARKMKKLSEKMKVVSREQNAQQLEADVEVLRQILDNLIIFSFEQEALLNVFNKIDQKNPKYARSLKMQSELRENFKHVDDSLYSLALRNPMINEKITEKLTNVEFDLEKSIERLSENEIPQGTASQQYVVTGANDLANLLDNILGSLQEQLGKPGSGSGDGKNGFQLQDIIEGQQKLQEKLQEGFKPERKEPGEQFEMDGEGRNEELFEMYKQQQLLRMQLEELLKENGLDHKNPSIDQMKQIEEQLLDKGMDPQTLKRMQQLQYDLLKLEKAKQLQGEDERRKSEFNKIDHQNPLNEQIDRAKEYFNSTEILNRQALPLRQIYKDKVREYFGKGRD